MKVFKVWVDKVHYDEYDACIVVADSVEAVRAMMVRDESEPLYPQYNSWEIEYVAFYDRQGEIHIDEIDMTKPGVVLSSFNAG